MSGSRKERISRCLNAFLASKEEADLDATLRARLAEGREQLIASLEDGTVFSILESLRELQELKENELWALHEKEQVVLRAQACAGHFNVQGIRQSERNMLQRIDKMVEEQQATLIATGLPMFRQSLAPEELSLQMAIIRFITTLGHIYDEEGEEDEAKEKCGCV